MVLRVSHLPELWTRALLEMMADDLHTELCNYQMADIS